MRWSFEVTAQMPGVSHRLWVSSSTEAADAPGRTSSIARRHSMPMFLVCSA